MMSQQHRLGVLHVGTTSDDGVTSLLGPSRQHVDQFQYLAGQATSLLTQIPPQQRNDLVVTRATSTQTSAKIVTSSFHEAALEGGVNVLVIRASDESSGDDIVLKLVESLDHALVLLVV